MIKIFKFKNWEIFLILFFIPLIIFLNLPLLTKSIVPSIILVWIWIWGISIWLCKIVHYFRTEYLNNFEFQLYHSLLIVINLIIAGSFLTALLLIYSDLPIWKEVFISLSKANKYLQIFITTASVTALTIVARTISARKLQRKISFQDYYKRAISFIFLPIGIFWIQNDINQLVGIENLKTKYRGALLIVLTLLLIIGTIINFDRSDIKVSFGNQDVDDYAIKRDLLNNYQRQSDSLLNSMNDSTKAAYIFNDALQLYKNGDSRSAVDNITLSIQLDSFNSEYYFARGIIQHELLNHLDSAILDMTKTITLAPSDWRALNNRAYYNYLLENYDKALPDINKVIELKPDFSNAFLLRALLKEKLNDTAGACIDLNKSDSLGNKDALIKILEICN